MTSIHRKATVKHSRHFSIGIAALLSISLTACTIGDASNADDTLTTLTTTPQDGYRSSSDQPSLTRNPVASEPNQQPPTTGGEESTLSLSGKTIYIDPGHAAIAPPAELTAEDGRGGTKSCNTTGTASNDGWPEHEFNWEIAAQLQSVLEESGAKVLMSRTQDGRADCIDERTYKENSSTADVVVSLHADGSGEGNSGFHISSISDPLPQNKSDESHELASSIQNAMFAAGLSPSNYLGESGLYPRSDLAGLNLSSKPKVLIEFGNMRDSTDLAALQSVDGRQQRAEAVAAGIADYLT